MLKSANLLVLLISSLAAYIFTLTPYISYFPQVISAIAIIFILTHFHPATAKLDALTIGLITFIVNLLVFATNGVNSSVFFLMYFLLFALSFQLPPLMIVAYAFFLILILSQSLNSPSSLLPLFSLIFVSPLAWFVGIQHQENIELEKSVSQEQTDIIMWISLRFKNSISQIIDTLTMLSLDPKLSPSQKRDIINIRRRSKSLLTSSRQLIDDIEEDNPFDE